MTQLALDWVRERRAAYERAYPDVPSETRETAVSAAAFAAFDRSEPYRGSGYAWVVRDPADAPSTSASTDAEPDDRPRALLLLPRGETDQWGVPGGGIEPGEDHETAARREVREETGVDCELSDPWLVLHRVWSVPDEPKASHSLHVFFDATYTGGDLAPQPGEANGVAWFATLPDRLGEFAVRRGRRWSARD